MRVRHLALLVTLASARLTAQGVDPRGDWRTLATPHFRVHYVPALEDQGRRAAAAAEEAYTKLSAELARPRGLVDLVVADNADVSNGYATPLPSNRIVVYAQPPVDASSLRFYDDWLQLVITHELTHIFHLDRSRGIWAALQGIFGRHPALFPNGYGPSWLTEGLAVYYESRLTSAGRLIGTEHRLVARAAATDARVPRLDELSLAGSVFPLGERAYAYGSLVVDYTARTNGAENVRKFIDRQAGQLIPWRVDHAARKSFGASFTDAWRAWRDSVNRSASAGRSPGDGPWRELTSSGWFAAAPRWIDGRTLLYAANDGRSVAGVVRVDVDGNRRRVGRRNSLSPNVLLPDGRVLFAQLDYADPYTLRSDLYVQRDTLGGAEDRLTYGARLSRPDARRDGAIVAVQSGAGSTWLVRVSGDGATITPLTVASPDTQWTEPRWSPDGRRLVAVQLTRGARSAIVVLDTNGRPLFDVVRDRAVNSAPSWSANGRRVYWSSDRSGAPQLYVAAIDGGTPLQLSHVATGVTEPAPGLGGSLGALLYHADGFHVALADSTSLAPSPSGASSYVQTSTVPATAPRVDGASVAYTPWRTLLPRYWSPVFGVSDGGSGTLGASTSGNDIIGRHAYYADAAVNLDNGDVETSGSYRYARFGQPLIDVSGYQTWLYDTVAVRFTDGTTGSLPLSRRVRSAAMSFLVRRPRVRNGASLSFGAAYEWRDYKSPNAAFEQNRADALGTRFPLLFASGAWSNTRRPIRSISAEDGVALSASAQQRWQNGRLGPQSRRVIGVARGYKSLDLPGFAHHVVAVRVAGGLTDAKTATELTAGGVSGSSAELAPGLRVGDPARTFGVRGFPANAQRGIRAAAGSLEYRAPLAVPARGLKLLPVFADRLSMSLFGDAASAWCPTTVDRTVQTLCLRDTRRSPTRPTWLASTGAELALDAAISYDVPLRFRVGAAVPVAQRDLVANPVSVYFTLGISY